MVVIVLQLLCHMSSFLEYSNLQTWLGNKSPSITAGSSWSLWVILQWLVYKYQSPAISVIIWNIEFCLWLCEMCCVPKHALKFWKKNTDQILELFQCRRIWIIQISFDIFLVIYSEIVLWNSIEVVQLIGRVTSMSSKCQPGNQPPILVKTWSIIHACSLIAWRESVLTYSW